MSKQQKAVQEDDRRTLRIPEKLWDRVREAVGDMSDAGEPISVSALVRRFIVEGLERLNRKAGK